MEVERVVVVERVSAVVWGGAVKPGEGAAEDGELLAGVVAHHLSWFKKGEGEQKGREKKRKRKQRRRMRKNKVKLEMG